MATLWEGIAPEMSLKQVFDFPQGYEILFSDQGYSIPFSAGSGSASDAMYIIFGVAGAIVVDDHLNVVNVDAPTDNVGGNEYVRLSLSEASHYFIAFLLAKVGMHLCAV